MTRRGFDRNLLHLLELGLSSLPASSVYISFLLSLASDGELDGLDGNIGLSVETMKLALKLYEMEGMFLHMNIILTIMK